MSEQYSNENVLIWELFRDKIVSLFSKKFALIYKRFIKIITCQQNLIRKKKKEGQLSCTFTNSYIPGTVLLTFNKSMPSIRYRGLHLSPWKALVHHKKILLYPAISLVFTRASEKPVFDFLLVHNFLVSLTAFSKMRCAFADVPLWNVRYHYLLLCCIEHGFLYICIHSL